MSLRSLTSTTFDKSRLNLCERCRGVKIVGGACMLGTCKGCRCGLDKALAYCSVCSRANGCCQRCTDSLNATAAQPPSPQEITGKQRQQKKVSLIKYLKGKAQEQSLSWEEYAAELAGNIDDSMDKRYKRNTIRISLSPCIDKDERRQVNSALSEAGYGQETRDLTIGEIYRQAKQQQKS